MAKGWPKRRIMSSPWESKMEIPVAGILVRKTEVPVQMSRLGELAIRAYVGLLPKQASHHRAESARNYHDWQYETSAAMFASFPEFDFQNKRILDLGCGLGGRATWLARNG